MSKLHSIAAFDSAYPGSMFQREDGGYIQRDDADSLAGALLALIASGDRAAEDAEDALKEARAERNELLAIVRTINRLIIDGAPVAMILDENSPTLDAIRVAISKYGS